MLDLIGTIVLPAMIAVNITVIAKAMPVSSVTRLAIAAVVGAWSVLAAAVAAAGLFADTSPLFPWIGAFVAFPPVAVAAAAALFPTARRALLAIPLPTLVGVHIERVVGIFFLLLAWADRLGGPFPYSAGLGDIITGVAAITVVRLAATGDARHDGAISRWNAFGALDLFAAIALAVISSNGAPLQLIHAGAGPAAVLVLPWALIPSVVVPFYLITHGIVLAQLWARRASASASTCTVPEAASVAT